jgi:hypothetical protein
MNLVEISRLNDIRKKLDKLHPICIVEQEELVEIKDILDDMLEFKVFPTYDINSK